MRIHFPPSDQAASRSETRSNCGSYFATFVVGVLGFVVGNLALDAIKEQIHRGATQLSSQPILTVAPPTAAQTDLRPSPAPQSVEADPSPSAAFPRSRPAAEQLQPQEANGQPSDQVRLETPATPPSRRTSVQDSAGLRTGSDTAGAASSAYKSEMNHDEATSGRLNSELAERYFDRGLANGQHGNYDKAVSDFNEVVRLTPKSPVAYYSRGVTYWYKGNHDRAAADFNEAIRLDPKLAVAYYGRGCVNLSYGYKAQAEADFAHAKILGYSFPKPESPNIIQMSLSILQSAVPQQ